MRGRSRAIGMKKFIYPFVVTPCPVHSLPRHTGPGFEVTCSSAETRVCMRARPRAPNDKSRRAERS